MYFAFLDEAGSIALAAKTGRFMCIVVLGTHKPQGLHRAVRAVKKRFGIRGELSASRQEPAVVRALLKELAQESFEIVVVVIDKRLTGDYWGDRENLYNAAVVQALQRVWERYSRTDVTIHRRHSNPYLRGKLDGLIQAHAEQCGAEVTVQHLRAKDCTALEAADAVAWAVFQNKSKRRRAELYQLVQDKIVVEETLRQEK